MSSSEIIQKKEQDMMDSLMKIVLDRYGIEGSLSHKDEDLIYYSLLGVCQRDGYEAAVNYAKTAKLNLPSSRNILER